MRRAPIVLTATAVGLVGVLAFEPREPQSVTAVQAARSSAAATASGAGGASAGTTSGATTATGDAVDTRYGPAQVRVTISGGRIVEIEALQLQANDPKSQQISSSAEPLLRESALAKQSAAVDAVSGATITSASYEASLQSALDKAGFAAADGTRGSSEIPEVQEDHHGPGGGAPPGEDGFFLP